MDPVVVSLTFGLGYLMHRVGLPPLVGFLLAGFGLHTIGYTDPPFISTMSDIGVTLLLFTIGLKLRIKSLLKPEVWAGASIHMGLTVPFIGFVLFILARAGSTFFLGLDFATALLLAFGLSFSSTVFAVKILEESGRMNSLNGRTAIGVLIIQDILAVVYLTLSASKNPSAWAFVVIGLLPVARVIFLSMLDRVGHGELQVLFGIFLALIAGATAFDTVGLKADLGALVLGMLIAPHPRAKEMAKSLMSIKDILLVGFFLKIGLSGLPDASGMVAVAVLVLILPLKMFLYFLVFTRFKFKARTAFITTVNLASYSEFGLIVFALAVASGRVDAQWLVVLAISLSVSLVIASPLNRHAECIFNSLQKFLVKFEAKERHPEELPYASGSWRIGIAGMGPVGVAAYDYFQNKFGDVILGLDFDSETVDLQKAQGRNVIQGDVADPDFWRRLPETDGSFNLLVIAIPDLDSILYAVKMIRGRGYQGNVAAAVQFDDQEMALLDAGLDAVFNISNEAGAGFAAHICETLKISYQ